MYRNLNQPLSKLYFEKLERGLVLSADMKGKPSEHKLTLKAFMPLSG